MDTEPTEPTATTSVMESTPVPSTITRPDGTTTTGTANIVHPAGAAVPERMDHTCGPRCTRCTT